MTISANVGAVESKLIAELSDGRRLEAENSQALAQVLYRAGIQAAGVGYEWRTGLRMLTAGQQVALSAAIRTLERKHPKLARAA